MHAFRKNIRPILFRFVTTLGLKTDPTHYNVPKEHVPRIVAQALGGTNTGMLYEQVVELVEGLY